MLGLLGFVLLVILCMVSARLGQLSGLSNGWIAALTVGTFIFPPLVLLAIILAFKNPG